jgi:type III secretory pathway component EscR
MRIRLTLAGVALSLASFAFVTTPVIASGQQQNQNSAVQITQQPRVESTTGNSATIA